MGKKFYAMMAVLAFAAGGMDVNAVYTLDGIEVSADRQKDRFGNMITDGLSGIWWNSLADICLPVNGVSDMKILFLIILTYCLSYISMRNSVCKSLRCSGVRNSVPSNQ